MSSASVRGFALSRASFTLISLRRATIAFSAAASFLRVSSDPITILRCFLLSTGQDSLHRYSQTSGPRRREDRMRLPFCIAAPWVRPKVLRHGLLYRHNIGNRRGVVCSSSVTSGWNTDLRAMEWLVSRDIESDIAFLRRYPAVCVTPGLQDKRWRTQSWRGCRFSIVCATPTTRPSNIAHLGRISIC